MTQEDKDLLFKDLCARLPYGVKLQKFNEPDSAFELYSFNKESGEIMFYKYRGKALEIADVGRLYRRDVLLYKPFLRSMSSMTEEEKEEFHKLKQFSVTVIMPNGVSQIEPTYIVDLEDDGDGLNHLYDWLNAHHFDYRGLIEKGLALEAPEGMYNY